jgi:acyl-CoA synthetase (AMP-forming)/AMP-acid ligase II
VTIASLVAARAASDGGRIAVISVPEAREISYGELDSSANRIANSLIGLGVRPGDRIACWMATSVAYLQLYLAVVKIGAVIVPTNERYLAEEAEYQFQDCDPRVIVADNERLARFGRGSRELAPTVLIGIDDDPPVDCTARFSDLLAGPPQAPPTVVDEDSPMIIGYTSGTTGFPKGAVLTHTGVKALARINAMGNRLPVGSVAIFGGSMSFTASVPAIFMTHLYLSGTIVIVPSRDPDVVGDAIQRYHANFTSVAPPLVDDYAREWGRHPELIASLRSILQAAGKVPPEKLAPLNEVLQGRLVLGWGMTENCGGLVTATTVQDMRRALSGASHLLDSVGRPVPDCIVRVLADDGQVLPRDGESVGELVFRSSSLMAGYTGRAARDDTSLRDGWYHTGDLGAMDEEGYVYIRERRSDLIVSGGMNIYPSEVERVIGQMGEVAECCVVSVPHPRWGRAVAAVVVPREGARIGESDVIDYVRARLASFKKPTRVVFVDAIPMSVSGKIQRRDLVSLFADENPAASTAGGDAP